MKQQLIDLRTRMQQAGVDAYIIPRNYCFYIGKNQRKTGEHGRKG